MKISWNVYTGYVHRSPNLELEIPDEDLKGLNEKEIEDLVEECVEDEFYNKISFYWRKA